MKRKNDEAIPRRYGWLFGILAIVMLIGLRFPVRILTFWALNSVTYVLLVLGCLITLGYVITRYGWQKSLVTLILVCAVLASWQVFASARQGDLNHDFCTGDSRGLITRYRCTYIGNCPTLLRDYVTLGKLPIGIELLDYYDNPCGYPRQQIEQM
jgi:CDP-diglyceride synthetase